MPLFLEVMKQFAWSGRGDNPISEIPLQSISMCSEGFRPGELEGQRRVCMFCVFEKAHGGPRGVEPGIFLLEKCMLPLFAKLCDMPATRLGGGDSVQFGQRSGRCHKVTELSLMLVERDSVSRKGIKSCPELEL